MFFILSDTVDNKNPYFDCVTLPKATISKYCAEL